MSERTDRLFETACAELLKTDGGYLKTGFVSRVKALDVDTDEHTVSAVISDETVDRDHEVVLIKGMDLKAFRANPVVLFMHRHDSLIGKAQWVKPQTKSGGRRVLIAKTQFAVEASELALEVFNLVAGDYMRGTSVGMNPFAIERRVPTAKEIRDRPECADARILVKTELVEYSFVAVPANAEALTTAVSRKMLKATMPFYEPLVRAVRDASPRKVVVRSVEKPVKTVVRRIQTVKRAVVNVTVHDIERGVAKELAHRAGRD